MVLPQKQVSNMDCLFFNPDSESFTGAIDRIPPHDLLDEFDKMSRRKHQKISWIEVYATPLSSDQAELESGYQAYVVMETQFWFYSLEKSDENIILQRSKSLNVVRDKQLGVLRKLTQSGDEPECVAAGEGKDTIRDVLEYLFNANLFWNTHNTIGDNSKRFAKKIFDHFNCDGVELKVS